MLVAKRSFAYRRMGKAAIFDSLAEWCSPILYMGVAMLADCCRKPAVYLRENGESTHSPFECRKATLCLQQFHMRETALFEKIECRNATEITSLRHVCQVQDKSAGTLEFQYICGFVWFFVPGFRLHPSCRFSS